MGVQSGGRGPTAQGRNILVAATEPTTPEQAFDVAQPQRGIVIAFEQDADGWLQTHTSATGSLPTDLTIVSVGDTLRSTAASTGESAEIPETPPSSPTVATIPDPTNLSGLGLTITKSLKKPTEHPDGDGTVVVFDSLNGLLAGVSLHRAFRFLHLITSLVRSVGATAYYRIDPIDIETHDVETIRMLFDVERGLQDD